MSSNRQALSRTFDVVVGRIALTAFRLASVVLIAVLAMAGPVSAQGVTGTVSGTVKDAQGGVVPGATVTLISETKGTRSAPSITNATGDFVFPNVPGDTYTVQVEMPSFKMLRRPGVAVSAGSQVAVGTLTIELGGMSEVLTVTTEAPLLQAASGERSSVVVASDVQNLPMPGRVSNSVLDLVPGVNGPARVGGGGGNNYLVDGITAMEIGGDRLVTSVTLESVEEVKVVVSSSSAEFGRAGGMQVNAVTKSGTNQFRGSLYDVERKSAWNANSRTNILNGDPKVFAEERDYGFSLGGPIGKPGGTNRLFFFFVQEVNPRTQGNNVNRYRMPTLLERQGDFSQSRDNNGNLYPYIKDPLLNGTCSAVSQAACFADGGVLGRIPQNRLYQPGLNVLRWWPEPNIANVPAGQAYNFENTDAKLTLNGWQPVFKVDYQISDKLRTSYKFLEYQQTIKTIPGTLPGFNDTKLDNPATYVNSVVANYVARPTLFFEASYGTTAHHQEGCTISGVAPNFCRSAMPMNQASNRLTAGMGDIPYLFPDAPILNPNEQVNTYKIVNNLNTPIFDGTRIQLPPQFSWGNRITNAPPNVSFPGNFIDTFSQNLTVSVTKIWGSHTVKAGFYYLDSRSRRNTGNPVGAITFGNDTSNPLDTSFGYSNAAIGVFSQYAQASKLPEGYWIARNIDEFVQDNWKVRPGLTLDYGVRIAYAEPMYDGLGLSSNFLPDRWQASAAPRLYVAGCANNVYPCTGATRQARDPQTGQFLGANSILAIGTLVPNTGTVTNGLFLPGQGIVKTQYQWDTVIAPRFGAAWDVRNDQRLVLRGGLGLYVNRPSGNSIYNSANNPPNVRNVTVRYGQLQNMNTAGLTTEAAPSLFVNEYDRGPSKSAQWNGGLQMALPWAMVGDVAYAGQHSWDDPGGTNINAIDFGVAFLPEYRDPSSTATGVAASVASLNPDLARGYKGFSTINLQHHQGWRTFHSVQLGINRRFRNGFSFSLNDTISLYDHQSTPQRWQHDAQGYHVLRADQGEADRLLGTNISQAVHLIKGSFVWALPQLRSDRSWLRAVGLVINDWQLSGVYSADTGTAYSVGYTYTSNGNNVNLTGSPDYAARVKIVGDTGRGCSGDPLRQFNTAAFEGPGAGSVGLESGADYMRACGDSTLDLAVARTIRLGGNRTLQLRLDMFNAMNGSAVTARNATMQMASPATPTAITNLPFDANGNVVDARSRPRGAGFGVATNYQSPRTMQIQARFAF